MYTKLNKMNLKLMNTALALSIPSAPFTLVLLLKIHYSVLNLQCREHCKYFHNIICICEKHDKQVNNESEVWEDKTILYLQ